jgi:hypothetical protein
VLLAVAGQLLSALAILEIDGVARRMLLCPPDLDVEYIQALAEDTEIDAVVADQPDSWAATGLECRGTSAAGWEK